MLKVGDIVRIKTWEEMLDDENVYEDSYGYLNHKDFPELFNELMREHCGKIIIIKECNIDDYCCFKYDGFYFSPWMYEIIERKEELTQNCHIKNEENESKQEKIEDKVDENSNKTPILSDGYIVKNKKGEIGIVLNGYIRYFNHSTLINADNISKIYKVKENSPCGYRDILNSFEIDRYYDVIWEKTGIEQSLDNLDIGAILKVKFKEDGKIKECTVGNIGGKRILIYDCSMACLFDVNKHEILEIKEYTINDLLKNTKIEQSLDGLEIGTKVKVKNKLLNITETLTVGRFNSKKVLIRDGLTCYKFSSDKYEILEIIK